MYRRNPIGDLPSASFRFTVHTEPADKDVILERFVAAAGPSGFHCDPRWAFALAEGLGQKAYFLVAEKADRCVGVLPLVLLKSALFGRFLVSLPYADNAGVVAENEEVASALIDRAVRLADKLQVRYLELRHESEQEHPAISHKMTSKVQMRLDLTSGSDTVWKQLKSEVRTQIRKAGRQGLRVDWGRAELLRDFYDVFSVNMRDLGTPAYGLHFFESMLAYLSKETEFCVLRLQDRPIAAALTIHGWGVTEAPSASSLRAFRSTAVNSFMYWHLIQRAIDRGQDVFDFGRSTVGCNTFRFKKKWGAQPVPTVWQYYVRRGKPASMRPDAGRFHLAIRIWRRLPISVTRRLGPLIVRGIP